MNFYSSKRDRGPRVYFIVADSSRLVKIGYSADLENRFRHFQHVSPASLRIAASAVGTRNHERAAHRKFAAARSHGEWFRLTADISATIERLNDGLTLEGAGIQPLPDTPGMRRYKAFQEQLGMRREQAAAA